MADLHKPRQESFLGEIDNTIAEALKAAAALESWAAPVKPSVDLVRKYKGFRVLFWD